MRVAIVADIHGNATALRAVLQDVRRHRVDALWMLGDVCGYGPSAATCMNLLETEKTAYWLMGNHDWATMQILQGVDLDAPSVRAMTPGLDERKIASWHAQQCRESLCEERLQKLRESPFWAEVKECPGVYLAHGAVLDSDPYSPENVTGENAYIGVGNSCGGDLTLNQLEALYRDGRISSPPRLIIVGHSHIPFLIEASQLGQPRSLYYRYYRQLSVEPVALPKDGERPVILSSGSVGQPRDGDTRAAYAILDWERRKVWFCRVEYDIGETVAAMVPQPQGVNWQFLCTRLRTGK